MQYFIYLFVGCQCFYALYLSSVFYYISVINRIMIWKTDVFTWFCG